MRFKANQLRRTLLRTAAVGVMLPGVATEAVAQPVRSDVGNDHLILGVDNLERGMAEFAKRTGVTPIKGGIHPGKGTQNALASLDCRCGAIDFR